MSAETCPDAFHAGLAVQQTHGSRNLQKRGLSGSVLIVSDAHSGLKSVIAEEFPGASWQLCNVHFMCNILVNVPHHGKEALASELKEIWTALTEEDEHRTPVMFVIFFSI